MASRATTPGIVINETALAVRAYINQLAGGTVDKNSPCPENLEGWQSIVLNLHAVYQDGWAKKGQKGAMEYVQRALFGLRANEPKLDFILGGSHEGGKEALGKNPATGAPPLVPMKDVDSNGVHYDLNAVIDPGAGSNVRGWIDDYIEWAQQWATRGNRLFHEGTALWILSAVAMRRIRIPLDAGEYTGLYIVLVADTSSYTKSSTTIVARQFLDYCNLDWIVLPPFGKMTPEFFYQLAAGHIPDNFNKMTPEEQDVVVKQVAFSGQRPLYFDEFGHKLSSIVVANGRNHPYYDVFLEWHNPPTKDSHLTKNNGQHIVYNPYLAVLGNMVPDDVRSLPKAAQGGSSNPFTNGLFARFIPLTPPAGTFSIAPKSGKTMTFPRKLAEDLINFHMDLGVPEPLVEPELDKRGDPTGRYEITRADLPVNDTVISKEAFSAYTQYDQTLTVMINKSGLIPKDLRGNYARLADNALRVAALLAWMDNGGRMEWDHWAAAQNIAEGWRISLHEFYAQVSEGDVSYAHKQEEQIMRCIGRMGGWVKCYDIQQRCGLSSRESQQYLESLVAANVLITVDVLGGKSQTVKSTIYGLPEIPLPDKYVRAEVTA